MEGSQQVNSRELLEGRGFPRLDQLFRWSSRVLTPIISTFSRIPRSLASEVGGQRASFGHVMFDCSWAAEEARGINEHFRVFYFEQEGSQVRSGRFRGAGPVVRSLAHIRGALVAVWFGLKPFRLRGRPPSPRRELIVRRDVHIENLNNAPGARVKLSLVIATTTGSGRPAR